MRGAARAPVGAGEQGAANLEPILALQRQHVHFEAAALQGQQGEAEALRHMGQMGSRSA